MSRYDAPNSAETREEPGAEKGVMENLRGIKTVAEINELEAVLFRSMVEQSLEWVGRDSILTSADIRRMHQQWLGSLYSWAGRYRTVNISKGGVGIWCPAQNIAREMERFEAECLGRHTPCRETDNERIVDAMTEVHEYFLLIHPFRDGNGRIGRWLLDLMALQANLAPLDWSTFTSKEGAKRYFSAMGSAHAGKLSELKDVIRSALVLGQSLRD